MNTRSHVHGFVLIGAIFFMVAMAAVVMTLVDDTQVDYSAVRSHTDHQALRYAVEAGIENARWSLSNNTSCANYADIDGTMIGTAAYRSAFTPDNGSPVSIVATARDAQGNQMSAEFSDSLVFGTRQTMEVRMTPDDQDTEIEGKSNKQDHNHFDRDEHETSSKADDEIRILLQFTLPDLPASAQILSATITLEVINVDNTVSNVFVYRLTRRWDEEDVNWIDSVGGFFGQWGNGGGDYDANTGGVLRPTAVGSTSADITSIVQSWYSGGDNNGIVLIADPAIVDVTNKFASGQWDEEGERPLLTIEYACECGTDCANPSATYLPMLVSFDDQVDADGQTFEPGDAFSFDPVQPDAQSNLTADDHLQPNDAVLTAIFVDDDGSYVLSTRDGVTAGGQSFSGGDVFRLDTANNSATLLLASSQLGSGVGTDAVHMLDSNTLVFSITADGTIDGDFYYTDDLIAYNLSGDSFTRYLDGFLMFPSTVGDVDAAHVYPSGMVALSFAQAETVAGVSVDADDLLLFEQSTETASLYYDNTLIVQSGAGQENLNAFFNDRDDSPAIGDLVTDAGAGCTGQYRDDFSGADYSNSVGSLTFATDWLEVGESDGASSGDVRLMNDSGERVLRIRDNNNGGEGVEREFDLTSATAATLTFLTRRDGLDEASDYVALLVSDNGGSTWTELDRFEGPATDGAAQSQSYDLSGYRSNDTRIRLISSPTNGNSDTVYFDDVTIRLSGCP